MCGGPYSLPNVSEWKIMFGPYIVEFNDDANAMIFIRPDLEVNEKPHGYIGTSITLQAKYFFRANDEFRKTLVKTV